MVYNFDIIHYLCKYNVPGATIQMGSQFFVSASRAPPFILHRVTWGGVAQGHATIYNIYTITQTKPHEPHSYTITTTKHHNLTLFHPIPTLPYTLQLNHNVSAN